MLIIVRSAFCGPRHKLITSHQENGPDTDALYDVATDPDEMNIPRHAREYVYGKTEFG